MEKSEVISLIKNKNFLFLWVNQALTQAAYNLVNFTLLVWVYKLTGSSLAEAVLILTMIVPSALFSVLTGLISDFYDRRKIMFWINIIWVFLVFFFLFSGDSLLFVLALTFLVNTINRFFTPAEQSALPTLVKKSELLAANSLFSISLNGSFVVGLGLAGPLMLFGGDKAPFLVAGMLVLVGAFFVYFLPSCIGMKSKKGAWERLWKDTRREFRKGYEFVKERKVVKIAIITLAVFQVLMNIGVTVGPGYAEQVLKIDVRHISMILAFPGALGSLIGIYLMQRWQGVILKREMVKRGVLTAFIGILGLGMGPILSDWGLSLIAGREGMLVRPLSMVLSLAGLTAVIAFFLGIAFTLIAIPVITVISEQTPSKYLGRVWGVTNMFQFGIASIPLLFVGYLADKVGLLPLVLVFDFLILISYLYTRSAVFDKIFED